MKYIKKILFTLFTLLIILSINLIIDNKVIAQNRKPNFSQLDFDSKSKPKPTPEKKFNNPIDKMLYEAQQKQKGEKYKPRPNKSNNKKKNQDELFRYDKKTGRPFSIE